MPTAPTRVGSSGCTSRPTATSSGECVLDVGGRHGPGRPERFSRYRDEEAGEDLRLLYVALTRAQCQVVTWWAPSFNTPASALHRFASRRPTDPAAPQAAYPLNGDPFSSRELGPGFSVETDDSARTDRVAVSSPSLHRRCGYGASTASSTWPGAGPPTPRSPPPRMAPTRPQPAVGSEPDLKREDDESAPGRPQRRSPARARSHRRPRAVLVNRRRCTICRRASSSGPRCTRCSNVSTRRQPTCPQPYVKRAH